LPHSLHGGSGLIVKPVAKSELSTFDPLTDTIPDRFKGRKITIATNEKTTLYLGGKAHSISNGEQRVPEYVGINLMAQEKAKKVSEFDFN
jgi:DNA primase small subunit